MKPTKTLTFSTFKQQSLWQRSSYFLSRLRFSSASLLQHQTANPNLNLTDASAFRAGARTIRRANKALLGAVSDTHIFLGILLMAVAPVCEVVYLEFEWAIDKTRFWDAYYFLYEIGPHASQIIAITGLFLLLYNSRLKFFAAIPATYQFAKILWLAQISTNAEFHQVVHWSFILLGASTSLLWFMMFDYLMALHYHKFLGPVARMKGLLDPTLGISDKDLVAMLRKEKDNVQMFI